MPGGTGCFRYREMVSTSDPGAENVMAHIHSNAGMVVDTMNELTDFEFGYDDESLEFLDGYLDRQSRRGDHEQFEQLANTVGCYVGECLVAMHGGKWVLDVEVGWMVAVGTIKANPFAKTHKALTVGLRAGQSVRSFVHSTRALAKRAEEER